jgi:acetyl-CoA acetyltransferase
LKLSKLSNRFAIAGVGYTPQGKVPGRSAASFYVEAAANAIKDAGLKKTDIDALILYRHFDPVGGDVDVSAFTVAEQLGVRPFTISQETYCTRTWLTHAIGLLATGLCRNVVVVYGDNARSGRRTFVKELSNGSATDDLAAYGDLSTLAKYAMLAQRAMYEYNTGPEVWKEIAIAQRQWANLNPIAGMYSKVLDDEGYFSAEYVAEPFRLLDATPTSDGGRAIVLTTAERARDLPNPPILITGFGQASAPESPFRLKVNDEKSAAAVASKQAFEMAGMTPKDIDVCELYDCFTYTVESTLCDYGFFKPGESRDWITRERIGPGGSLPVNTSGGMLSEAYFMGLTPIAEGVMQLMGRCGDRQLGTLKGTVMPKTIMCSDNGGVFQSHCSLILQRGG